MKNEELDKKKNKSKFIIILIIFSLLSIFIIVSTVLSLMYLGINSLNEILMGIFLGIYFMVFYRFYLEKLFIKILEKLILINNTSLKKKLFAFYCLLILIFMGCAIASNISINLK